MPCHRSPFSVLHHSALKVPASVTFFHQVCSTSKVSRTSKNSEINSGPSLQYIRYLEDSSYPNCDILPLNLQKAHIHLTMLLERMWGNRNPHELLVESSMVAPQNRTAI
jgi:hypothetical protein